MSIRHLLATTALLALAACHLHPTDAHDGSTESACLTGPTPHVGRAAADASYVVLRDRWDALPSLPPLAQAALLPTLRRWIPDVSDRVPEPACAPELAARLSRDVLAGRPIPLSRLTLSRMVTSGAPDLLAGIAALPDDAFTAYTLLPDEPPGHAITAADLRRLVARSVEASSFHGGRDQVLAGAVARILATDDALALLDLDFYARDAIDSDLYRGPTIHVHGDRGRSVMRREIVLLRRWIEEPHRGDRFELALRWIRSFGRYGWHYGAADEIDRLLAPVIARRGDVPLARGYAGAQDDLRLWSVRAAYDLRHPQQNMGAGLSPPRRSEVAAAPAAMMGEAQEKVAASTPLPPPARSALLALLERQLAKAAYPAVRCHLLKERVGFSLPAERPALLAAWIPDATSPGSVRFGDEQVCALALLHDAPSIDDAMLRRLLALAELPEARLEPVQSPPPGGFSVIDVRRAADVPRAAAKALLDHAPRVAADPQGLAWLEAFARRHAAGEGPMAYDRAGLRASEVLLPILPPSRAQEIVRQWMTTTLALLRGRPPTSLEAYELLAATQYSIARWAPRLAMQDEAARHFVQARSLVAAWASELSDGMRELDGLFAVCEAWGG